MSEVTFIGKDYSEPIANLGLYPDNTPFIKTDKFHEIVERADTVMLRPTSINSFFAGLAMVSGITYTGGHIKNLILPYIPGARQDRVNPTGDVLSTLALVSQMINIQRFQKVVVADPHSIHSMINIDAAVEYPLRNIYSRLYKGYDGVIAPDKGGYDRACVASDVLGKPLTAASKVRDVATGRLSGFEVNVEAGKHYIVVDDICDGGGTFVGLGEKIRAQGAFADLFVTHGIFSKGTDELKKIYKNIYTTNTRDFNERNDVYVFDIVKGMIDYV